MELLRQCLKPEVIWAFIGLILLFIELALPGFIVGFFALGAWVVAVVSLFTPLGLNDQLALFLASSIVLLVLARSWLKGLFTGHVSASQDTSTDLNDFVGERAVVTERITPKQPGRVELHGTPWLAAADEEIAEGRVVEIREKDNLTLKVKLA